MVHRMNTGGRLRRRIISDEGFSLVECVVAIAVFAIMSMMVAMIIAATQLQYKRNIEAQMGLGEQVDALVDGESKADGMGADDSSDLTISISGASGNLTIDKATAQLREETYDETSSAYTVNSVKSFFEKMKFYTDYDSGALVNLEDNSITVTVRQVYPTKTEADGKSYNEKLRFEFATLGPVTTFSMALTMPMSMTLLGCNVTPATTANGLLFTGLDDGAWFEVEFIMPKDKFDSDYVNCVRFFNGDKTGQKINFWDGTNYQQMNYREIPVETNSLGTLGYNRIYHIVTSS